MSLSPRDVKQARPAKISGFAISAHPSAVSNRPSYRLGLKRCLPAACGADRSARHNRKHGQPRRSSGQTPSYNCWQNRRERNTTRQFEASAGPVHRYSQHYSRLSFKGAGLTVQAGPISVA